MPMLPPSQHDFSDQKILFYGGCRAWRRIPFVSAEIDPIYKIPISANSLFVRRLFEIDKLQLAIGHFKRRSLTLFF